VVLIAGFGWVALRSLEHKNAEVARGGTSANAGTIAIELPGVAEGSLVQERPPNRVGDPPKYSGGATQSQLDQSLHGRSGQHTTPTPATNLSDKDEQAHLTRDLLDRLDHEQQQRVKSARERSSWEDRRSSKDPMELSFLASGTGTRNERRPISRDDPSRGGAVHVAPAVLGATPGAQADAEGATEPRREVGSEHEGSLASASGIGVHDGRLGLDHRASAQVTRARPSVVLAAISVPAARHGRTRDDIDSDQEVATAVQSIVHASTAAGVLGDEGSGGVAGGGDPGAGGMAGAGSTARPIGPGDAEWWDLNTTDPRFLPYFRRIHQKLDPLWAHAFPLEAAAQLRQGTVIFAVTIAPDGGVSVAWPPERPSGIPEFDHNCFEAIKRAAPFDPIPSALGLRELHVRMPFDARNPIVK
jgi:TonB family protein